MPNLSEVFNHQNERKRLLLFQCTMARGTGGPIWVYFCTLPSALTKNEDRLPFIIITTWHYWLRAMGVCILLISTNILARTESHLWKKYFPNVYQGLMHETDLTGRALYVEVTCYYWRWYICKQRDLEMSVCCHVPTNSLWNFRLRLAMTLWYIKMVLLGKCILKHYGNITDSSLYFSNILY